jgi:hypothetical protein
MLGVANLPLGLRKVPSGLLRPPAGSPYISVTVKRGRTSGYYGFFIFIFSSPSRSNTATHPTSGPISFFFYPFPQSDMAQKMPRTYLQCGTLVHKNF